MSETEESQNIWWTERGGKALIALYLIFTGIGIFFSIALMPEKVSVPPYVYLYGFLGALAYIFTSLLTQFNKSTSDLLKVGIRIPAALLLVAAVYLLITFFVKEPTKPIIAGLSFLIGLYIKLALEGLGGLASRLLRK